MQYIRQLDGLRACAVIGVIIFHWTPKDLHFFSELFKLGAYGVDLFFVLSGFLITSILLHQKTKSKSFFENLKIFIIRRSLRIFPLYYLYLLFSIIFLGYTSNHGLGYALTYTFNLYTFFYNWSSPSYYHHLWSLSAEEQFYIFWPFFILKFNVTKLKILLITLLLIGLTSLTYLHISKSSLQTGNLKVLPIHSFIALSLGGTLAIFRQRCNNGSIRHRKLLLLLAITFYLSLFYNIFIPNFYGKSLIKSCIPIVPCICLIILDKAITGFYGILQRILESRIIVFIGKISYGLYVYHMITPEIMHKYNLPNPFHIGSLILLITISILSYQLFEKPILNLKKKFNYD